MQIKDPPGGPVVKTPHLHCRGYGFNPWWGNKDPPRHMVWPKKKKGKRSRSGDTVKKSTKGVTRVPKGEETGNRAEVILRGKNENFQI